MTFALCVLKTGLAGLFSALIYKGLSKLNKNVAIILSGISVPIINTAIFIVGVILFFLPLYGEGKEGVATLFSLVITVNFLIEFLISVILSPAIIYIIRVTGKSFGLIFEEKRLRKNEENKVIKKNKNHKIKVNLNIENKD